jgi:hypothetical protein
MLLLVKALLVSRQLWTGINMHILIPGMFLGAVVVVQAIAAIYIAMQRCILHDCNDHMHDALMICITADSDTGHVSR